MLKIGLNSTISIVSQISDSLECIERKQKKKEKKLDQNGSTQGYSSTTGMILVDLLRDSGRIGCREFV